MTLELQVDPATGYILVHSEKDIRPGAEPGTLMLDCCCGADNPCNDCDPALRRNYIITISGVTHPRFTWVNGVYTLPKAYPDGPQYPQCMFEHHRDYPSEFMDTYPYKYSERIQLDWQIYANGPTRRSYLYRWVLSLSFSNYRRDSGPLHTSTWDGFRANYWGSIDPCPPSGGPVNSIYISVGIGGKPPNAAWIEWNDYDNGYVVRNDYPDAPTVIIS